MSLNLEDLRQIVPFGATRPDGVMANRVPFDLVPVSESEVIGLAVQLLKERPEVQVRQWYDQIALHPVERYDLGENLPAGAYLIVPLSILGDEK